MIYVWMILSALLALAASFVAGCYYKERVMAEKQALKDSLDKAVSKL